MNNHELEYFLSSYGVEVVCAEELPAFVKKRPRFYVVNTDSCGKPGKHWVVFYFSETICEFYDSLGCTPQYYHTRFKNILLANGSQYRYMTDRIQALDSDVCGQYCIYFIMQRHLNRTLTDICGDFVKHEYNVNDTFVSHYVAQL